MCVCVGGCVWGGGMCGWEGDVTYNYLIFTYLYLISVYSPNSQVQLVEYR